MSIDTQTAARVAKLARIEVDDADLPVLAEEFNAILGFIEQLAEVDIEGVEPMTSVTPMRLKRRDDEVSDGDQQSKVLKNAPDAREGFFAVPKVME
ncbi:MAG: Asp-tRNA(Asn)/Glu-tRNA(Gln) amidotransferase subunit GatC [Pseudomonadota bacterium]